MTKIMDADLRQLESNPENISKKDKVIQFYQDLKGKVIDLP